MKWNPGLTHSPPETPICAHEMPSNYAFNCLVAVPPPVIVPAPPPACPLTIFTNISINNSASAGCMGTGGGASLDLQFNTGIELAPNAFVWVNNITLSDTNSPGSPGIDIPFTRIPNITISSVADVEAEGWGQTISNPTTPLFLNFQQLDLVDPSCVLRFFSLPLGTFTPNCF